MSRHRTRVESVKSSKPTISLALMMQEGEMNSRTSLRAGVALAAVSGLARFSKNQAPNRVAEEDLL